MIEMATNKKELKEGDKLFRIMYYDFGRKSERNWESYTIKKIKGNRIYLKGGYHWTFSLADLGDTIFTSKKEAAEHTLKLHKEKLEKMEKKNWRRRNKTLEIYGIEPCQKEIKYLEKKMLELILKEVSKKRSDKRKR